MFCLKTEFYLPPPPFPLYIPLITLIFALFYMNSTCSAKPSGSDVAFARYDWASRRYVMVVLYVLVWCIHESKSGSESKKKIKEKMTNIKEKFRFRLRFYSV